MSDAGPKQTDANVPSDPLSEAIQAALAKLKGASDPAEIERALNIIKVGSEIQKTNADTEKAEQDARKVNIDANLASKQTRHALLTSMFSPLVPLASLLTVVVTLFVSSEQTRIARDQAIQKIADDKAVREEAAWNAFVQDREKSSADDLYKRGTFSSRLRAFAATGAHDQPLADITKHFMIDLSTASAFQDIWKTVLKETKADNFDTVVELSRARKQRYDQAVAECGVESKASLGLPDDPIYSFLGPCSPTLQSSVLYGLIPDAAKRTSLLALKDSYSNDIAIIVFLSTQIADYVRKVSNTKTGAKPLDLSNTMLLNANLQDVDFSQANLAQAAIAVSNVDGAVLLPKQSTYDFNGTPWWEAKAIDQTVMQWLLVNNYPERPGSVLPPGYKISRDEYQSKIQKLCTSKTNLCTGTCLRYGPGPAPTAPECNPEPAK
jgi:hypothetical protein